MSRQRRCRPGAGPRPSNPSPRAPTQGGLVRVRPSPWTEAHWRRRSGLPGRPGRGPRARGPAPCSRVAPAAAGTREVHRCCMPRAGREGGWGGVGEGGGEGGRERGRDLPLNPLHSIPPALSLFSLSALCLEVGSDSAVHIHWQGAEWRADRHVDCLTQRLTDEISERDEDKTRSIGLKV